jgi:hypothetical protein
MHFFLIDKFSLQLEMGFLLQALESPSYMPVVFCQ